MHEICPLCGEKITEEDRRKNNVETLSSVETRGGRDCTIQKSAHKKCRRITK